MFQMSIQKLNLIRILLKYYNRILNYLESLFEIISKYKNFKIILKLF